jgi:anti-sigma regulatory factor (Ser/Thr protein kinase)
VGVLAVNHDPASAAIVRRSIFADLTARSVPAEAIDDVVLVASELIGNAVLHTSACVDDALDVTWDLEPDAVVVGVRDASETLPELRATNPTETGGRGLTIVAALALDWGVRRNDGGKQVWARVPISH